VAASTDTQLIIEHSGNAGITILTPNSGTAQLSFGCPAENRQGSIFYDQSANMMTLRSGNDNLKRITLSGSSGDATIYSNLVIGTAGKGIDFGATTGASGTGITSGDNVLDWYEEGSFTPFLTDNSTTETDSQGYSYRVGRYVRIGRLVHFQLAFTINDLGNLTGSQYARIAGLPFVESNVTSNYASVSFGYGSSLALPSAGDSLTGYVELNTSLIALKYWTATGGVLTPLISEISVNAQVMVSGTYETA
jgi:hypothetical protein